MTILNDCMADNLPVIWVKVSVRGRKPIVIGGTYREFHHIMQPPPPPPPTILTIGTSKFPNGRIH